MIIELALFTLATVIPVTNKNEKTIILRNGQSASLFSSPKLEFEDWSKNTTLTFTESSKPKKSVEMESVFVSPVKSSIKVKMKIKIGGKVSPIPVDSNDIVFLDE